MPHANQGMLAACLTLGLLACRTEPQPHAATAEPPASPTPVATPAAPEPERPQAAETAPTPEPEPSVADQGSAATLAATADHEEKTESAVSTEPYTVLILGDSLAATGFGALLEKRLDAHPNVVCHRKAKSASGLARPDFFDWMDEARKQIDVRKPDLVVVIMGGNDGQDLATGKGSARVRWQSDGWTKAYRERVVAFLETLRGEGRKVLWLGLPRTGTHKFEQKLELIRTLQQEAIGVAGDEVHYLDTSPFLTRDDGALLHEAPVGKRRKPQRLREEDGIHFTMAGSEFFADQVYPEVLGILGLATDEG